jgi:hypothetical protein
MKFVAGAAYLAARIKRDQPEKDVGYADSLRVSAVQIPLAGPPYRISGKVQELRADDTVEIVRFLPAGRERGHVRGKHSSPIGDKRSKHTAERFVRANWRRQTGTPCRRRCERPAEGIDNKKDDVNTRRPDGNSEAGTSRRF